MSSSYKWLINLGLIVDIIGFILLWAEWHYALKNPKKIFELEQQRLGELQIAKLKELGYSIRLARNLPTHLADSEMKKIGNRYWLSVMSFHLWQNKGKDAHFLFTRRFRFNLGGSLIVSGFLMQLIGNNL